MKINIGILHVPSHLLPTSCSKEPIIQNPKPIQFTTQEEEHEKQLQSELQVYSRRPRIPQQNQPPELGPNLVEDTVVDEGYSTVNDLNATIDDLHVPIAIRKRLRSCTQHPISNYLILSCHQNTRLSSQRLIKWRFPKMFMMLLKIQNGEVL